MSVTITVEMVKELRAKTDAGMGDCKRHSPMRKEILRKR